MNKKIENLNSDGITLDLFRKEYLWGFTNGNPMHNSKDNKAFFNLIHLLTGDNATITIGASFHPYQIIDSMGSDIWEKLFDVINANNYCDYYELIRDKYFFHMTPPGQHAFPIQQWNDRRLLTEQNKGFSKYVPFLIPYLTYNHGGDPEWLVKIKKEVESEGHAHKFIDIVNRSAEFLMPEPTFIIGFDIFDKNNQSALIDKYVDFWEKHLNK